MNDRETRVVHGIEVRKEGGKRARLIGYAAVFNSRSLNLGGFIEIIRPGAFARALKTGTDVRAYVEHDAANIIGRRSASTLDIGEDDHGLRVEITPPDTQAGNDVVENVRVGNLDGMSFAFRIPDPGNGQKWDFDQEPPLRELLDLDLHEVSIVSLPAYPSTDVALRSLTAFREARGYRPAVSLLERKLALLR